MLLSDAPSRPLLCLVTNRHVSRLPLEEAVAAAVAGGVDWVQVRERELEAGALLQLVGRIVEAARRAAEERSGEVRVLVNRRLDIAHSAGADGVHLGFDALPPWEARALLGEAALIGVSTHTPEEVVQAKRGGASYVQLAPIFPPLSKRSSRAPLGLSPLAEARASGLPVLAQGGIDPESAAQVIRAGAWGVAVTGGILGAADPEQATAALRRALNTAGGSRSLFS